MAVVEANLTDLKRKLFAPFEKIGRLKLDPVQVKIKVAQEGSKERQLAADVIDCVYNSLYRKDNGNIVNIGRDRFDSLPGTVTLVGTQEVAGNFPVVVTLRVVSDKHLEIFDFFQPKENTRWPHEVGDYKAGEIGRLSFNPGLDFVRANSQDAKDAKLIDDYKRDIFRMIYSFGLEILRSNGVETPYYMVGPHVNRFLVSCGLYAVRIDNVESKRTPEVEAIRQEFRDYWYFDKFVKYERWAYLAPWKFQDK